MNRGKIVIILCVILLSIQIASADVLNLTASTNETFADNRTVLITANLTNTTGYPVSNTRVNFTTDCGILSAGYNNTNASGIAVVNISSWDLCTANITAEAGAANATVNVTFVMGPISQIVLSANSSGTVNSTHLVTAAVYDRTAVEFSNDPRIWRVMSNVTLNFSIAPPPSSTNDSTNITPSTNATNNLGITTAIALIDKCAGSNLITVMNVTNEDGVTVQVSGEIVGLAGEATNIAVTASPENVSANGIDLSHVTGKVIDEFGNPLLSTGAIRFNVTDSDPIIKPLNSIGEATISIGPSKFTGSVAVNGTYINVTGDYTNLTDSTTVIFYAEEPVKVVVTADATKISTSNIPGVNVSMITATVIDKWGHTLSGRTVNFSTNHGTLSSATGTTDSRGQVTITLQSDTAGDATVAAKVLNDSGYELEGSIVIRIVDKPFISVITTIEPDPIEPGGIINVTTSVSGQGNITGIRLAAHALLTLDRSGSMDPDYYAGTPLDIMLVTDVSGSMDPDYMCRYGENQFGVEGFTSYNFHANGSVNASSWSNNFTFTVNATPVNDFNTRLYWYAGGDDLRLQLISPSGLVYGYQGTASGYDYYNPGGELRECVWIDLATYSYPSSADTDTLEQGTWTVRVCNTASASRSFDITTHLERLSAAKIASKEFNRNMVSNSRVGLISFGGGSGYGKRINTYSLSCNISYINERSDALWAYGGTPTADAIQDATNNLVSNQRTGARPYIILLSDGEPTIALDGSYDAAEATADAISEAGIAKNTVINGYDIKIYTIGFGTDASGNATMESIASSGCYYYAATIDQLHEIYYNIAQQISDFDITTRQYGVQGFTPYGYDAHDTVNGTLTDTFIINETINDFKVEIDNPNLNFTITSPSNTTYPDPAKGGYVNRTGYYETDSGKYVWLTPVSGQYPLTDADTVEKGTWNITITGSGEFNITSCIDKKSAAKLASHAFIESLNPIRYDRVGLATYSYSSMNETATQESYVCQGNQWEGYFTVNSYAIHYFNLSWADASDLDLYLYDGITLLDSSNTSKPEMVSAALSPGTNYSVVVNGTNVTGNDTQFTINVFSTTETVNSGTATVPLESTTVDIPPVDLNKTFLIVKSSDDLAVGSNAYAFTIRGHFIDNDTIEFTRESSSGEGEVSYFVIQADNIEVQSGTTILADKVDQANVLITSVTDNTTKCFVTLSTSSDNKLSNYVHESWVTGELTANDTLTLKRANSKSKVTVDWFVIRFTDNTTVQTGETSWTDAHTATQAITSVNTSNTWLYFTSRMTNNGLAHTSIKGEITDSTTLTFSKHSDSTAGTDYVRYFVINFSDGSGATVQSGTASASSGDSTVDIGITPVNRARAFAFVTNDCKGTGKEYARPYWISYFTADNNLKMQRWYTGEPVVHKWQVVEWPEGASVGITDTPVNWLEWQAKIDNSLTDSIFSFDLINTSIDALTADGMTAIDEGLYEANNALCEYFGSKPVENGTIVLMTDGIDNVGYHSMIAEAERAAANNTTIFTVGFGSDIDDRVLRQIANITGGTYYPAGNASELENIFVGIAGELGNFTAPEPSITIRLGNNATVEGTLANVTYINDSASVTYFNCTLADCSEGQYEDEHPSNPNVTYAGDRTILSWDIGNRPDRIITVGRYWNVTYQLRIDNESKGYVPIILDPSCVTYEGAGGEGNCSNNLIPDANVDVVGNRTDDRDPAETITLTNKAVSGGPPFRPSSTPDTVQEYAYRLTASLKDEDENPVEFGTVVEFKATSGTLYNYTHHNTSCLLNGTTGLKGDAIVWLSSDAPGTITVCAHHTTANGTKLTPACNVVIFHSLESPPIIPPAPRPRGVITLESDPLTDWLSLLWRNR